MRKDVFPIYFMLHENPLVPLLVVNGGHFICSAMSFWTFTGIPVRRYAYSISSMVVTPISIVFLCSAWHFGPYFVEFQPYTWLVPLHSVASMVLTVM
jgi:hypothetical protein